MSSKQQQALMGNGGQLDERQQNVVQDRDILRHIVCIRGPILSRDEWDPIM
jgi:hypothetical protein